MKVTSILLSVVILTAPAALRAQYINASYNMVGRDNAIDGAVTRGGVENKLQPLQTGFLNRMALGLGVSPLGPSVQLTTSLTSHLNLRLSASGFRYSTTFSTNGFDSNAKLSLGTAGIAADIYPFHKGFRISPGLLMLNHNRVTATSVAAGGTAITLNDQTFYSANTNSATGAMPLSAYGSLGLSTNRPAFTVTTGWGNMLPRNGGHFSFPFEVGVAFIGAPKLQASLSGWACSDQAQTDCSDVTSTTDTMALQVQNDLSAQISKWENDLAPLKTYPIVSFGIAYSFNTRGGVR